MRSPLDTPEAGLPSRRGSGPRRPPDLNAVLPLLVWQLYEQADERLRPQILACLLQPLGPLALASVASGAFRALLPRPGLQPPSLTAHALPRLGAEQVQELARFAFETDPGVLVELDSLLSLRPAAAADEAPTLESAPGAAAGGEPPPVQ